MKKVDKVNLIKDVENSETFKHWLNIKKKNEKQGQTKQKEVKVYYIGIQNFAQLPETWRTQQICWSIFVSCVHDLSHPKSQSNIMPSYCILFCAHGNLDVLKLLGMRW